MGDLFTNIWVSLNNCVNPAALDLHAVFPASQLAGHLLEQEMV